MGSCLACGHEYERHLFGGMCFHCDCKKASYNTGELVFFSPHTEESKKARKNGASPKGGKKPAPRLGNK
jgi:hypothetical protein